MGVTGKDMSKFDKTTTGSRRHAALYAQVEESVAKVKRGKSGDGKSMIGQS